MMAQSMSTKAKSASYVTKLIAHHLLYGGKPSAVVGSTVNIVTKNQKKSNRILFVLTAAWQN